MYTNKNYATSVLISNLGISDTTMTINALDASKFPATGENFIAVLWGSSYPSPAIDPNREIITATTLTGNSYVIVRGREGTTQKAWVIGDHVALILSAAKVTELEDYLQNNLLSFGSTSGVNSYTVSLTPALKAYSNGINLVIYFNNASTSDVTLNVNGLGAKKIYSKKGGVLTALGSGDIWSGLTSLVVFKQSLDFNNGGWIITNVDYDNMKLISDQTVSGIKTFNSYPKVTNTISNPTDDYQLVHKKYVDNTLIFPSGTSMLFNQAFAPVGWTKKSDWGGRTAIFAGNDAGSGGNQDPYLWTTTTAVADHVAHLHTVPAHNHQIPDNDWPRLLSGSTANYIGNPGIINAIYNVSSLSGISPMTGIKYTESQVITDTSSGGPTTHQLTQSTFTPRYQTVIVATKN